VPWSDPNALEACQQQDRPDEIEPEGAGHERAKGRARRRALGGKGRVAPRPD
jgi:hypothetical protein